MLKAFNLISFLIILFFNLYLVFVESVYFTKTSLNNKVTISNTLVLLTANMTSN